jgi:hypothetical protein
VPITENGWYSWSISGGLATAWYNGSAAENGIILVGMYNTGSNYFRSTEYTADPTKQPFFVFTYTAGAPLAGNPHRLKRIIQQDIGGIYEKNPFISDFITGCPVLKF